MQVMDRDIGGHRQAFALGGANQIDTSRRRQPAQMNPAAIAADQLEDGVQGYRLGTDRHARQAQPPRDRPAVRHTAARQKRVLGPQPDGESETARVLHRTRHDLGINQCLIGLRKPHAAGLGQLSHLGQHFALQTDSERTQRIEVRLIKTARPMLEHLDQTWLIKDRIGIRRTDQTGDTAGECGLHLGLERRLVLKARLAQTRRQIDQARADHQPAGIDHPLVHEARRRRVESNDTTAIDMKMADAVETAGSIDKSPIADRDLHRPPARMLITAIRTAIPKVTCLRITDCVPSATADSISTPRFIGPGCITIASGLASASFSAVRP